MLATDFLLKKDELVIAIKLLAVFGLQQKNIKELSGLKESNLEGYINTSAGLPHKFGTGWMQNRLSGVIIDRVIRVYESLNGDILVERNISPVLMANMALAYYACYPYDTIGITRMYQLLLIINSGGSDGRAAQIHIEEEKCIDCNQRYHIHMRLTRRCSACQIKQDIQEDPKLIGKLKKAIYTEGGNLKAVNRASITEYINQIREERALKQKRMQKKKEPRKQMAG